MTSRARFSPTPFGRVLWAYAALLAATAIVALVALNHG